MEFDRKNKTGKAGERAFKTYVEEKLGLIYRRTPPPDIGIDGDIETISDRHSTGGFLKAQVKTTEEELKGKRQRVQLAALHPWVTDGRLRVPLPDGVPLAEFRSALSGALRHLRLQEATLRADFLERRCDAMASIVVHPRYTPPRAADHDHRDAVLVEDMYVLDPAEAGARLLWLVVAAQAAAMEGPSPW